jgi:uncharacterized membrane protein
MENELFYKILFKPLIFIILVSLWPLLTYIVPPLVFRYLQFFYLIQLILILNYIRLFLTYLRFKNFPNYEEARSYFSNLKRLKNVEPKNKNISNNKLKKQT